MQTSWIRSAGGFYSSPLLAEFDWLEHRFGAMEAGDWLGHGAATLHQIHSAAVMEAGAPGRLGEGDALVTGVDGLWLAVRTADCYPIVLADPVRRAIAVVHSGWRGAAADISGRAVQKLLERFGTQAGDVRAAVGPGIGMCCYEVGADVAHRFHESVRRRELGGWRLDLLSVIRGQLEAAGVRAGNIDAAGLCTFCVENEFCSYRREGRTAGRMVSGARVRQGSGGA